MEKKSIGSFLTALRKTHGLTQRQLAEKLNVSDKAVSRWERDECAPDLSLIPVLAEIYGVTSDEILSGQRMDQARLAQGNDSAKVQKQRKRILSSAKTKFLCRSFITVAITLVGLILAYILNSEFGKANAGFWVGGIFFVSATVNQLITLITGFAMIADDEWQDDALESCKGYMVLFSQWVLGVIAVAAAFCIPLAGSDEMAVPVWDCIMKGIPGALIAGAAMLVACLIANLSMKRRKTVNWKQPRNKRRIRCGSILALVFLVLLGMQMVLNSYLIDNRHLFAPHDVCDTLFSFRAAMETPLTEEGIPMYELRKSEDGYTVYEAIDEFGEIGLQSDALKYRLYDEEITKRLIPSDAVPGIGDNPFTEEFGYQFRHRNLYISYYEVSDSPDLAPIYTFNAQQLQEANEIAVSINFRYLSLYALAAVVIWVIYNRKGKRA